MFKRNGRTRSVRRETRTSCKHENPGPVDNTREKTGWKSVIEERKVKELSSKLEV
jgi:hypothetical protein